VRVSPCSSISSPIICIRSCIYFIY
jgi:hypothetical protein